jgi:hypothetical protein
MLSIETKEDGSAMIDRSGFSPYYNALVQGALHGERIKCSPELVREFAPANGDWYAYPEGDFIPPVDRLYDAAAYELGERTGRARLLRRGAPVR